QEALEAVDALVVDPAQLAAVARDGTAPEADVDVGLARGDRPLGLERVDVDRRRDRVQRHVDQRGHPAGGRGPGRRVEALPFGAARFVDVHVRVDEPGDEDLPGGQLDDLAPVQCLAEGHDGGDPPAVDAHLGRGDAVGQGDVFAAHDQVVRAGGAG